VAAGSPILIDTSFLRLRAGVQSKAVMTAAKEELHVFSLAAFRLLDEKPRLGHCLGHY
jgi:hypothetical protein